MSVETANQTTHPPDPRNPSRDQRKLQPLALGVERIGLISLRDPTIVALVAIALMIGAAFGAAKIKVDNLFSRLFRSDSPEFRQYEEVTQRFPSTEFDVLMVIEGRNLLGRGEIRENARSRHRPSADRWRRRRDFDLFGASAARTTRRRARCFPMNCRQATPIAS